MEMKTTNTPWTRWSAKPLAEGSLLYRCILADASGFEVAHVFGNSLEEAEQAAELVMRTANARQQFADEMKRRFPWVGTDNDAGSGADVIAEIADWYEQLKADEPADLPFPHGLAESRGYYACTGWSVADIKGHYPKLTDDQALEFFTDHEEDIRDAMIRAGHDAIDCFTPEGGRT